MRRRTFLKVSDEGINVSKTTACDVCLYNKTTEQLLIVAADKFNSTTYPSTNYSAVGIVCVPGTHNVYGDGSCGIISIVPMDCGTPTTGNNTRERNMCFGVNDKKITSLQNYKCFNHLGNTTTIYEDLQGTYNVVYFPSDNDNWIVNPYDTERAYYYYSGTEYHCPSPYKEDDSRNPQYYQTSSPSNTGNACSDFDGKGNTSKILNIRGTKDYNNWIPSDITGSDYPPVSICDMYYTDGTKQGDWYLPSAGEAGYIIANLNKINETITSMNKIYGIGVAIGTSNFWLSTRFNTTGTTRFSTGDGSIGGSTSLEGNYFYVRAFLRVK